MIQMTRQNTYEKGVMAEETAAQFLRAKGYEILAERYKTGYGEIDLVVAKDEYLVAVEVKARKSIAEAMAAVSPRSRKRIENALLHFVMENPSYNEAALRFDVVGIVSLLEIEHLDNAWIPLSNL